jgi:hypothetical protein
MVGSRRTAKGIDRTSKGSDKSRRLQDIEISASTAKVGDTIKVTAKGTPASTVQFSIPGIFMASNIPMVEDRINPGSFTGFYTVKNGDYTRKSRISVSSALYNGKKVNLRAKKPITISGSALMIYEAKAVPNVVQNNVVLLIKVKATRHCKIFCRISDLDTTVVKDLELKEDPVGSGLYELGHRIGYSNKASNGIKIITLKSIDLAENQSLIKRVEVELRNSELNAKLGVSKDIEKKLNRAKAKVVTLSDLRHADPAMLSNNTGISMRNLPSHISSMQVQRGRIWL